MPDVQEDVVPAQPALQELLPQRLPCAPLPGAEGAEAAADGAAGGEAPHGVRSHAAPAEGRPVRGELSAARVVGSRGW